MLYLGWTIREQGNAWVATKPDAKPVAPSLIRGSVSSCMRAIRVYEGRATAEDLELPV